MSSNVISRLQIIEGLGVIHKVQLRTRSAKLVLYCIGDHGSIKCHVWCLADFMQKHSILMIF